MHARDRGFIDTQMARVELAYLDDVLRERLCPYELITLVDVERNRDWHHSLQLTRPCAGEFLVRPLSPPTALLARTLQVYAVPLVRPTTVMGDAGPLALTPPGADVTVYDVIAEPPVDAGGVNVTVACALPAVALPIVGAPGTAAGVTLLEGAEAGPVPTAFVAVTVNVYAVPLVRPLTMRGEPRPLAVKPPGEDVAV